MEKSIPRFLRKMLSLVGSFWCILKRRAVEDLDHLFWNYDHPFDVFY